MVNKQKLSILTAFLLPALALSVYLLLIPVRTVEASCPGGEISAPCNLGGGVIGCQSGSGTCYRPGTNGIYVFCNPHPGPGTCFSGGCVKCTH